MLATSEWIAMGRDFASGYGIHLFGDLSRGYSHGSVTFGSEPLSAGAENGFSVALLELYDFEGA